MTTTVQSIYRDVSYNSAGTQFMYVHPLYFLKSHNKPEAIIHCTSCYLRAVSLNDNEMKIFFLQRTFGRITVCFAI